MHAFKLLQKIFALSSVSVHRGRLLSFSLTVDALLIGQRLTCAALARSCYRPHTSLKHTIKRVSRLLSNPHLYQERLRYYQAISRSLIQPHSNVIIAIDWSPVNRARHFHIVRATLLFKGRGITLFEEVHPEAKLDSLAIEKRFLQQLKVILPHHCQPIIVTDAGFGCQWYQAVVTLGWHYVGRLRGQRYLLESGFETRKAKAMVLV